MNSTKCPNSISFGFGLCPIQMAILLICIFILIFIFYYIMDTTKILLDYRKLIELFLGFYFAIIVAHYPIAKTVRKLWIIETGNEFDEESLFDTSAFIGWIERALYVTMILINTPSGIGFWLALKASRDFIWRYEPKKGTMRAIFQFFLIGSGLSVMYTVVGAKLIQWLPGNLTFAVAIPILLIMGNLLLYIQAKPIKN